MLEEGEIKYGNAKREIKNGKCEEKSEKNAK